MVVFCGPSGGDHSLHGKTKHPTVLRIVPFPSESPLVLKPRLGDLAHGALLEFMTNCGTAVEVRVVTVAYAGAYMYLIKGFLRDDEARRLTHRVDLLYKPYVGTGIARIYN